MISDELLKRARALHRAQPVVECHTDIPVDVYRRRRAGEAAPYCDDYVQRLRAGGVRFQLIAAGGDVPRQHECAGDAYVSARAMFDDTLAEEERCPAFRIVRTARDLGAAIEADEIGFVLHLEGARPVQPDRVRELYDLGLRSMQLTWNGGNDFADGVGVEAPRGLTPLGRELVGELDRLGILIDVAHLAEPGFWDLCALARGPVVCSHANAAALCPHPRNLSDGQIRAIAATGGVVGICFVAAFIAEVATLERVLDHVDHMAELVGIDALAVGPDYVEFALDLMTEPGTEGTYLGPEGLRRVETLPVFTAGLLARGYSEEEAAKIVGGNALRVLRAVLGPGEPR